MLCELKRALPHYCLDHGSFAGSAHNSRPWLLSSCSASSRDSCERKRICARCSSGLHDMLEKGCYWKHPQRKSRCCRATSSSPAFAQPRQLPAHGSSNLDALRAQTGLATLLSCTWLICRINSQLPALGFVKLRCKLTRELREEEDMHRLLEWPLTHVGKGDYWKHAIFSLLQSNLQLSSFCSAQAVASPWQGCGAIVIEIRLASH